MSLQKSSKVFKLLFFGQIKEVKGLDILLEAVAILKKQRVDVALTIAGKIWKDDFDKYQRIIDEKGINDIIIKNIRYIPDSEAWSYFNAANLVVLPYKQIYQSGVLLMAMSYGRAVLASDLPAFKEVVIDGSNGFLFNVNNSESLASVIVKIIMNKEFLVNIETNAYELIDNQFNWKAIGLSTSQIYRGLLDKAH